MTAPLQHRPTPLPTRTPIPITYENSIPNDASYAGASRVNPESKIKGQAPCHRSGIVGHGQPRLAVQLGPVGPVGVLNGNADPVDTGDQPFDVRP